MKLGTIKQKWKTIAGWFLQIYSLIWLALILFIIFVIPVPEESYPETLKTGYYDLVNELRPLDALIWVGVFCLGRWLIKKDKQQVEQ